MTATMQEALAKPLDAARVKSRPNGRGGQLSYLETHDAIRAANDIFGFGEWGHEIVELRQIPATPIAKDGKPGVCVGYVCTIRLTVRDCVPTSGIGYGDAIEYQASAAVTAHELAAKEAESDALKRALKNFGDQFGLALYDKDAARAGHIATAPTGASKPATRPAGTPAGAATDGKRSAAPAPPTTTELRAQYETLARSWARMETAFKPSDAIRKADEKLASAKAAGDAEPYRKFLTAQVESFMALINRRNADLEAAAAFPIPETNLEAAGKA